jgi:hypothetical protein
VSMCSDCQRPEASITGPSVSVTVACMHPFAACCKQVTAQPVPSVFL